MISVPVEHATPRNSPQLGFIIEDVVPGREYAQESVLERGETMPLAWFDEPDPPDGPYFEATLTARPSRLPEITARSNGDGAAGCSPIPWVRAWRS